MLVLHSLLAGHKTNKSYYVSNEVGCSVMELIGGYEIVTGKKLNISYNGSSSIDLPILVASADKIYRELGWKPLFSIEEAMYSAWLWYKQFLGG